MKKISIMIGGSMTFASEMKKIKKILENMDFEVNVPLDTEHVIEDPDKKYDMKFLKELGVGRGDAELVAKSDVLLILNYEKHGIKGYIGPGAYRDICVGWWLKKKLIFLHPYNENQNNHKYEMLGFAPIILNGEIEKIKFYLQDLFQHEKIEFRNIGKQANEIEKELNLTIDDVMNKLTQEFGELNNDIQKYRGRYCRQKINSTENVEKELGDVLLNLTSISYRLGIDPNNFSKYAQATLKKFLQRKEEYKKNQTESLNHKNL